MNRKDGNPHEIGRVEGIVIWRQRGFENVEEFRICKVSRYPVYERADQSAPSRAQSSLRRLTRNCRTRSPES